jgi:hypothetical protein
MKLSEILKSRWNWSWAPSAGASPVFSSADESLRSDRRAERWRARRSLGCVWTVFLRAQTWGSAFLCFFHDGISPKIEIENIEFEKETILWVFDRQY